jgi:hypothetical protein
LDDGLAIALQRVFKEHPQHESMSWKPLVRARVNVAGMKDQVRQQLPRATDIGRLFALRGTVIRVATARMRETHRACYAGCLATYSCYLSFARSPPFFLARRIPVPKMQAYFYRICLV